MMELKRANCTRTTLSPERRIYSQPMIGTLKRNKIIFYFDAYKTFSNSPKVMIKVEPRHLRLLLPQHKENSVKKVDNLGEFVDVGHLNSSCH